MEVHGSTLGTRLRHLLELLDTPLEGLYREAGLDYRPRYTPVIRALRDLGPAPITAIARAAGITHSAVSQTVTEMRRRRLISVTRGSDARERKITLTAAAGRLMPRLESQWAATNAAAVELDSELGTPLVALLDRTIEALERTPFEARIRRHLGVREPRRRPVR